MRAKIIETGEIVDVVPVYDCWQHIEGFKEMKSDNARYFDTSKINILCTRKKIDWEQRRFELSKSALQGMLANPITKNINNKLVDTAVLVADAVIAKLKENQV